MSLLDVCSKVVSVVLNDRAQKLLEANGHPMQFGATPKVGRSEAIVSLKTLLRNKREMDYGTHVVFIDLVKA